MITRGQKINDRYQIIRTIGEGGMANVYLAYDTILDRNVAVKILRGDLANDEKFVRRFQREAISASSLNHPNIVEMYDVGEDDGKYFIVMEYLEGQTLKSLIKKRGHLSLAEVIDIMLQLTSGIACAHDSYIIHRDIKPQNVLILEDGTVKITDFGIAMALNSNELTQTNSVMGSVHYLPPEQANGSGATIKSDIYSLGILMYELLTGKLPFKGENAVEIAIKQMRDPIPSVCEFNPEIPQSVENVILKAAAKNPKNRYENALEMHEDLETVLDKSRQDEKKYVYPYPEQEIEEETITRSKKQENLRSEKQEKQKEKKENKALMITGIVTFVLILVSLFIFFVLPILTKPKEVEVPDVSGMTTEKAEKELEKKGFSVKDEIVEKVSEEVEEGHVISTSPKAGRTVKKGAIITLNVSKGLEKFKLEDYTGKDYATVKYLLEEKGLTVNMIEKEVTDDDNVKDGTIMSQTIASETEVKKGDTISFEVAKLITVYPDFVNESYTLSGVEEFCKKYNITLESTAKETNDFTENTILTQSRTAGTKVVSGVTLRVTYAKKKIVEEKKDTTTDKTEDKTSTEKTDSTKES
ncbi:Stk1 family PASTA domain-containing Ser/Thr kinase [bacterium]|nr:Stk1 family PASTA domain-containing Ser/Thr kinase [bacterium]